MNEKKGDDLGGDEGPLLSLVDRQRILLSLAKCTGATEQLVSDVRVLLEGKGGVRRSSQRAAATESRKVNKKDSQEYLNVSRHIFEKLIGKGLIPEGEETAVGLRWNTSDLDWARESGFRRDD